MVLVHKQGGHRHALGERLLIAVNDHAADGWQPLDALERLVRVGRVEGAIDQLDLDQTPRKPAECDHKDPTQEEATILEFSDHGLRAGGSDGGWRCLIDVLGQAWGDGPQCGTRVFELLANGKTIQDGITAHLGGADVEFVLFDAQLNGVDFTRDFDLAVFVHGVLDAPSGGNDKATDKGKKD